MTSKRKLKILHVLKSSVYYGAENVVITIMKNLSWKYDMAYLAAEGRIRDILDREHLQYYLLDTYSRKQVKRVIGEYQPDIIHAHDFTATVLCSSISGKFRLISHLHYDPPWVTFWNIRSILYGFFSFRIDRVLTVSEHLSQNMIFGFLINQKSLNLKNPIDVEAIGTKAQEHMNDEREFFDVIFAGRFVEQKNPKRFINLIGELKKKGCSSLKCVMIGDGVLMEECKQMIDQMGLGQQIKILGFQDNPYLYMKNSKLMYVTSDWEGFGLVIAEANVLGVPVLATKTAGSCEVLGAQAWELCSDDSDFVNKTLLLFHDVEQYQRCKASASQRKDRFESLESYMIKLSSLYGD